MQGLPKWFNTKQDILNVIKDYPDDIKEYLTALLKDRLVWVESEGTYTLVEDANARLFQLDFTVQEVLDIVGNVDIIPNRPTMYHEWNDVSKEWVLDSAKKKSDALIALVAEYKPVYAECDTVWPAKITRGLATQASYTAARTAIVNEFKVRRDVINNG